MVEQKEKMIEFYFQNKCSIIMCLIVRAIHIQGKSNAEFCCRKHDIVVSAKIVKIVCCCSYGGIFNFKTDVGFQSNYFV